MIKKVIGALTVGLLLAVNANAASLSIVGPDEVLVGDTFQLEIWGNFEGEGLRAGGLYFLFDGELVQFDGITLNLPVLADFSCPGGANCPPQPPGRALIVWGEFFADLIAPTVADDVLMATLDFTAISAGGETLTVFSMADAGDVTGGWFGAGFSAIPNPSFGTKTVNVVPLPAAVWFMIGGLGTLLGFRRK